MSDQPKDEKEEIAMNLQVLADQLDGLPRKKKKSTILTYASKFDVVVIISSSMSAIIAGALNPLLTVIYGQLVRSFQDFSNGTLSGATLRSEISKFSAYFVYLAIGQFVFVYIATVGFFHAGERVAQRLRHAYLNAVIRQNIAFFDTLGVGEVTTRITSDMSLVQEGISGKIALSLTAATTFATAFIIAFVEYWNLALVLTSCVVVVMATNAMGMRLGVKYSKLSLQSYSMAATVAEEAISSIKHVTAFGIQNRLANRYFDHLLMAEKYGVKARSVLALMTACFQCIMHLTYGLSLWQGSRFLIAGEVTSPRLITITMAIVIGALAVGRVAPNAQAFMSSIAGANKLFDTIERISLIDSLGKDGDIMQADEVKGDLLLKDISLVYPSRADVTVLRDFNLHLPAGTTTAIVGASGCGKSSIVGLIERFYEPVKGHIMLDGKDIRSLNVRWLRQQISIVGQEPILFSTTIFENIRHGLAGLPTSCTEDETELLVVAAAKSANAHDFITSLPKGYRTEVGESGLHLSGGQRQRISIARALISNPKILLLDEATSALDSSAEREVQNALDTASEGRTSLVIAHRLSTVRRADRIVVLGEEGKVVEQGSHDELILLNGVYKHLVEKQHSQIEREVTLEAEGEIFEHIPENEDNTPLNMTGFEQEEHSRRVRQQEGKTISGKRAIDACAKEDELNQSSIWELAGLVWKLTRSETHLMVLGLVCAILAGLVNPVCAFSTPDSYGLLHQQMNFWSSMYLLLGIVAFFTWIGQGISLSIYSERLTLRARDLSFRSILRQETSFFDKKQHSTGALTALLSTKANQLAGLSGAVFGTILTTFATLGGGIILSVIIGWKLALVCTATIPIILACGWARVRMLILFEGKVRRAHENSASYAAESITAIRTVASLTLEDHVLQEYSSILAATSSKSLKSILKASTLYAASQGCVYLVAALGFWYGGQLISNHEYTMFQFFICFAALISGSQSVGAMVSFAPDVSKASNAAKELKVLFERTPSIDTSEPQGTRIERCKGRLEMQDVSFRYPSRPEHLVLSGFNLLAEPGSFVALVGASGCGKSTVISLLERFFDPTSGSILVDGHSISTLNVNDYRGFLSLVGQEAVIYQGSIRDNIVLGSDENIAEASVIQACRDANIFDFIMSLPAGFSTIVGSRGSLLSGGQKQRIAVARALLRDTRILLLDEATSALDADSEEVVQDALDAAQRGITTICVAHRLGTVRHADEILVMDIGRVVERGKHDELISLGGIYARMVEMQSLDLYHVEGEKG